MRLNIGNPFPLLRRAFLILLAGALAGLSFNAVSPSGIPLRTPAQARFEDLVAWSLHVERLRVTLKEAGALYNRKEAVFIDARPPSDYFAGHIPGALSLPVAEFDQRAEEVLRGLPKDAPIVTYCSGERCQSSIILARKLIESRGYRATRVFFDGWHAWNQASLPVAIGALP